MLQSAQLDEIKHGRGVAAARSPLFYVEAYAEQRGATADRVGEEPLVQLPRWLDPLCTMSAA